MRERIKDVLVEKMMEIHGEKAEGWWYKLDTLNDVADSIIKVLNEKEEN